MPIYNSYSDNDYDDDDYYIPTCPKSPPSPMLVLKGDESRKILMGIHMTQILKTTLINFVNNT